MSSLSSRVTAVCLALLFSFTAYAPGARAEALRAQTDGGVRCLVPVGHTVGVKLFADGVLVVGLSDGETPARTSGLREGDVLISFNGIELDSTERLQQLLAENGEARATLSVKRGSQTLTLPVSPCEGEDGTVRLGAWIRDSMAGIGTMTFYDPQTGAFGALGHGVTDVDTGALMPLERGSIMDATVKAVKRGEKGSPGELRGDFDLTCDSGSLNANTSCGIFGRITGESNAITEQKTVPIAQRGEVRTGKATILANIAGDEVGEYDVEIERIYTSLSPTRNMLVRVTDPELLEKTGGIVQGMSGSPILQDGRLVGAVTHVLVNDSTRGYGILIENMLAAAKLEGEKAS